MSGFLSFLSSSLVFLTRSALILTLASSIFSCSWILFRSLSFCRASSVLGFSSSAILSFSILSSSSSLPCINSSSLPSSCWPHLLISSNSFSSLNTVCWTCPFKSWFCSSLFSIKLAICLAFFSWFLSNTFGEFSVVSFNILIFELIFFLSSWSFVLVV